MLWIKEVEMDDSVDEVKSSRSVHGKDFPNFEMLDGKMASAMNKIIQNSQFKKKGSLQKQKAEKGDWFLRGRQIALMIYDYFRVTGAHDAVLDYADFILRYSSWWQYSGIRYKMGLSSTVDVKKKSIRWCFGKSVQIQIARVRATQNRIGIVRHGDSWEDIGSQLSKVENHGEEEYRSETSITKLWRQAWANWIRSSGKESKGLNRRSRRKRCLLPVERKRPVFALRPLQFPPRNPRSCAKNQNTLPPHLPSQPYHEVEVCRGRDVSEAKVTMGPFSNNRADVIWNVPARERLVNIGIRPSVNSILWEWNGL